MSAPEACTISSRPVDLAAADERRRVGRLPALVDRVEHLGAGGLGEQRELGHGVLGVGDGAGGPDADEDDLLQPELAVLDLGDVLELGAQPVDAAQGVPLGEVLLTGGEASSSSSGSGPSAETTGRRRSPLGVGVEVVPVVGRVERGVEVEVRCVRHMPSRVGRRRLIPRGV